MKKYVVFVLFGLMFLPVLAIAKSGAPVKPLIIKTPSVLPTATVGKPYTVKLQATGGTGMYGWDTHLTSFAPTGLGLSKGNSDCSDTASFLCSKAPTKIVGTPAGLFIDGVPMHTMTFTIGFDVTSGAQKVHQDFTLTVVDPKVAASALSLAKPTSKPYPDLKILTPSKLPNATVGQPYSVALSAKGGTGLYGWYGWGSNLFPQGLVGTINSSGVTSIVGIPTTAGTYVFNLYATSGYQTATKNFTLTVVDPKTQSTTLSSAKGTGDPSNGTQNILPPTIIYPVEDQVLDWGPQQIYMFAVNPVKSATGYVYSFYQNGVLIHQNYRDFNLLSLDGGYAVAPENPYYSEFLPGDLTVKIQTAVKKRWSEPLVLHVKLVDPTTEGLYDDFATCLKDEGAVFYGAFWCPHCIAQKALFGTSASLLPYVECSTSDGSGQTQACIDKGITAYPTWEFSDLSRLVGQLSLAQLAEKTSCELPQ